MGRVLLIDDDAVSRSAYARALRRAGHEVTCASTVSRGVDELGRADYDVVVTELSLGDRTAVEVLEWIHALPRRMSVVVLTAHGSIETAVDVMRRGAANYVLKPLSDDRLVAEVGRALPRPDSPAGRDVVPHAHSSVRLAHAVVRLAAEQEDARTVVTWARRIGVSPSVLRTWCRLAGVSARRALTFTRLVRAVYQSQDLPWRPEERLDITDRRTMQRLLAEGALGNRPPTVNLGQWLQTQALVTDPAAIAAIRAALSDRAPRQHVTAGS